jgi:hypothetical protein|uniref:Uncharacterized protein n=1 Tax=viral metagenome TaxID=1070528 RepID=A0A6C0ITA4_9ZZZZ
MESPFAQSNTIVFYLEPILNSYHKSYQNIITVSSIPPGPLSELVASMSLPKLSPFQQISTFASPHNCVNVLLRYPNRRPSMKNTDSFMTTEDIPAVLSYLSTNGYTIEKDLSDIMQKANIGFGGTTPSRLSGNRKMICIANYVSS